MTLTNWVEIAAVVVVINFVAVLFFCGGADNGIRVPLHSVKAFQLELVEQAQSSIFHHKVSLPRDSAKHQELRERVYQIRAELYALMEQTAA